MFVGRYGKRLFESEYERGTYRKINFWKTWKKFFLSFGKTAGISGTLESIEKN